ncbi:hypothetical protein R1flu_001631 [Riccia fluitans]|uniref:Uncharacterized protein n=1 Tax=Riccia fluitans TaxID=41844 RepID=A0ABD1Y3U1_9MARC
MKEEEEEELEPKPEAVRIRITRIELEQRFADTSSRSRPPAGGGGKGVVSGGGGGAERPSDCLNILSVSCRSRRNAASEREKHLAIISIIHSL